MMDKLVTMFIIMLAAIFTASALAVCFALVYGLAVYIVKYPVLGVATTLSPFIILTVWVKIDEWSW